MDQLDRPNHIPKAPSRPTKHPPGSSAKIEVLASRLERGESLWHPADGDGLDDPPPMMMVPRWVPVARKRS